MNDKTTQPTLDFDGARELWTRIFDLTEDEYDRLYEESWNQTDGWWNAYLRVRDAARTAALSLGVGSLPAWFVLRLGVDGWDSGLCGALALLVRPLIGVKGGITQEDYDTVSRPWAIVIGQVHPDDARRESPLHAVVRDFGFFDDDEIDRLVTFLASHGVTVKAD